jgi:D-lactate dehydrogenase
MKVGIFSTHHYEKKFFSEDALASSHELFLFTERLTTETAVKAAGLSCVCAFVSDQLNESVLKILASGGTKLIALRSAGYDHIDLTAARKLGLSVVRVPDYSPNAIAEHAVALIMSLNRKIPFSSVRTRHADFSIEGLMGFDLKDKRIGVIGTGRIGSVFARIMLGFSCKVSAFDQAENLTLKEAGVDYKTLDHLLAQSDILSLHLSLTPETRHILNAAAFHKMKPGVMIINTARGALIESAELIKRIKDGTVGAAGLDVYEYEQSYFFEDHSEEVLQDDLLARLNSFNNVIVTSHHAFLTKEAVTNIVKMTFQNISDFESGKKLQNLI